jgi:SAM-dependent methyltransferase
MSIKGFEEWLATPLGHYVLQWEQRKHDQVVADIFGFNAIQLGLTRHDFLRANRMPMRSRCDDLLAPNSVDVRADLHQLPFATASVDLVVLPHVLEFAQNPHQILREVERILVPEGHVLVAGFNPFSLWGLRRHLLRSDGPPWQGQYLSVRRLKDWFALLGFETRAGAFGCYAPAVSQEKWLSRFAFMEAAGDRWWPFAGAVYLVQAIKRVHGMRLVLPVWRDRLARAKALAAVTQKPLVQKNEQQWTRTK